MQWSGGIGSWAATELIRRAHPDDPITLLFADVGIEGSDLYRFNADASVRLGIPITQVSDGRTQLELFTQRSYLRNARIAPCSQLLEQRPCRRWLTEHTDPAKTVLYVGLEPGEQRRAPAITAGWRPGGSSTR
jgi:3'-phosphoadenosine 5'-phosphosulfate sulfotransferase (PAPS reductase)/FAD synthetase